MRTRSAGRLLAALLAIAPASAAGEGADAPPTTAERPDHRESARRHEGEPPPEIETPPLPEGMSLEDVLERAAQPPPEHFPELVPDDALRAFAFVEQLELRVREEGRDPLGWEAQGYVGGDYHRLWWKSEGEAVFDGSDEGETETELLYSRLVTPFWNVQLGAQYANEWEGADYGDRWSGVLALQGLAPGKVELDVSLYLSERAHVTAEIEGEIDLRLTQRLVLQPRAELGFAAQDVSERGLGAGMTDADLDLRLRYEVRRELAPYVGVRYRRLVGETARLASDAGTDPEQLFFLAGLRLAF